MGSMVEGTGWSMEEHGASSDAECVWLYALGPRAVRIALTYDGRSVLRAVPCEVLAHVLRVQGYDVVERAAEAAE